MANFKYTRTTQTALKVKGVLDVSNLTVDVDGEEKSITTLLSGFEGAEVDITVKNVDSEELDEPTE